MVWVTVKARPHLAHLALGLGQAREMCYAMFCVFEKWIETARNREGSPRNIRVGRHLTQIVAVTCGIDKQ